MKSASRLAVHNGADAAGREALSFSVTIIAINALGVSAFQMGVLNAFETVSFLILGIPAGYFADRYSTSTTLALGAGVKAAAVGGIAVGLLTGDLDFAMLVLGVIVIGSASTLSEAGQISAVPKVAAEPDDIPHLVSKLTSVDTAMGILIPGVLGITIAYIGYTTVLFSACLVLIFASLVGGSVMRRRARDIRAAPPVSGQVKSWIQEAVAGYRVIIGTRLLLLLTIGSAFSNFGLAVMSSVEAIYLIRLLGFSELSYGIILTLTAGGGFIGAILSFRKMGSEAQRRAVVASFIVQVVLALALISAQYLPGTVVLVWVGVQSFLWGVVVVQSNVVQVGWSVRVIPEGLLGRTSTARRAVTFGLMVPLGSIVGGLLGTELGINFALGAWVVSLLAAVAVISRIPVQESP